MYDRISRSFCRCAFSSASSLGRKSEEDKSENTIGMHGRHEKLPCALQERALARLRSVSLVRRTFHGAWLHACAAPSACDHTWRAPPQSLGSTPLLSANAQEDIRVYASRQLRKQARQRHQTGTICLYTCKYLVQAVHDRIVSRGYKRPPDFLYSTKVEANSLSSSTKDADHVWCNGNNSLMHKEQQAATPSPSDEQGSWHCYANAAGIRSVCGNPLRQLPWWAASSGWPTWCTQCRCCPSCSPGSSWPSQSVNSPPAHLHVRHGRL